MRVGDTERSAASERLAAHAAAGRLTIEELEARLDQINAAVFVHELDALEADLPSARPRPVARRRAPGLPLIAWAAAVALIVVVTTIAVGHPVLPPVLAVLLVWHAARRRAGRRHLAPRTI